MTNTPASASASTVVTYFSASLLRSKDRAGSSRPSTAGLASQQRPVPCLAATTYSVLTRLPGDARLAPADAAQLLNARFPSPLVLSSSRTRKLPDTLSRLGIAGGAVYDALVALAAKEHGPALATRDARPRSTYDGVGVAVIVVT